MDTAVMFPDPQLAVRNLLREVASGRAEPLIQGVTVSTKGPTGALPYVQIRSDASYRDARLDGRATIRVLVWHADEGKAQSLAGLLEALLLASRSRDVRGVSPLVGPIPAGDPATGEAMSYFTVTARLRPIQLD